MKGLGWQREGARRGRSRRNRQGWRAPRRCGKTSKGPLSGHDGGAYSRGGAEHALLIGGICARITAPTVGAELADLSGRQVLANLATKHTGTGWPSVAAVSPHRRVILNCSADSADPLRWLARWAGLSVTVPVVECSLILGLHRGVRRALSSPKTAPHRRRVGLLHPARIRTRPVGAPLCSFIGGGFRRASALLPVPAAQWRGSFFGAGSTTFFLGGSLTSR